MLIKFQVENFLSFDEKQEFSMIAGQTQRFDNHLVKMSRRKIGVLKSAIIYGANASGKSNVVKAIDFARTLIVRGMESIQTYNKHFRLEELAQDKNSSFEFEIKIGAKVYAYGFDILLKNKRVEQEWMYEVNKSSDKLVFERKTEQDGSTKVEFGIKFLNKKEEQRVQFIGEDTRPNELFLNALLERNVRKIKSIKPLIDVFDWFENKLTVIYPNSIYGGVELVADDETLSEVFCDFLQSFDTGILGIETKEEDIDKLLPGIPKEVREKIIKDFDELEEGEKNAIFFEGKFYTLFKKNGELKFSRLMTKHKTKSGKIELFQLGEESDGTQRMFDLIPALAALALEEKVFIIDELDRSLHTLLSREIITRFLRNATNGSESQLIVTTHETSLLDLKMLRRDEIWFIEKNKEGGSEMYSLEEFKTRHDKEVRKGYLHGRFGAIPLIKENQKQTWLSQSN